VHCCCRHCHIGLEQEATPAHYGVSRDSWLPQTLLYTV
jgi:hypothetical protein